MFCGIWSVTLCWLICNQIIPERGSVVLIRLDTHQLSVSYPTNGWTQATRAECRDLGSADSSRDTPVTESTATLSDLPKKRAYREVLVNQGPVDAIAGGREFRSIALCQGCAGKPLGTLFPGNRHRPAFHNHNQRLGGGLDCPGQDRLRLTLHDPPRNAPARQQ